MELGRLRAVFFDAFGTLLDTEGLHLEATRRILAMLGLEGRLSAEEFHERWDEHIWALWRSRHITGIMPLFRRGLELALAERGFFIGPSQLEEAMDILFHTFWDGTRLFDGARELLIFCQELGLRTAVVSDADPDLLRYVLDRHGLTGLLDATVISDEVGTFKPDPRIFQLALSAVGCGPGEALMVGDSLWRDVVGARRVGLMAALVLRGPDGPVELPAGREAPDIIVGHLVELKGPITALARGPAQP